MRITLLLLGIIGIASCSTNVNRPLVPDEAIQLPAPPGDAANHFQIVLDKAEYTREEASAGIQATVTNTSNDRDFYSNVGDGFNARLDQPRIFAVVGTQAVIERYVSGSVWENANHGYLVEGSRFVVLSAGKSYVLGGSIAPNSPGIYRIRLDYSDFNNDSSEPAPYHDYSEAFRVR